MTAWWHKPDPPDMEGYVPDNFYNGPDPDAYKRYAEWKHEEARQNKLAWDEFQKKKQEKAIQTKKRLEEASVLFVIQIFTFTILCVTFRAAADAHRHTVALITLLIASINFFAIKKIAHGQDNIHQWVGYTLGSAVGTYFGIWAST